MSIKFKRVAAVAASSMLGVGALVGIAAAPAHAASPIKVTYNCTSSTGASTLTFTFSTPSGLTVKAGKAFSLNVSASVAPDAKTNSTAGSLGITATDGHGAATFQIKGGGKLTGTLAAGKTPLGSPSKTSGKVSGKAPAKKGKYTISLAPFTSANPLTFTEGLYGGPLDGQTTSVKCTGSGTGSWTLTVK